jgi:hypothetical protein
VVLVLGELRAVVDLVFLVGGWVGRSRYLSLQ